MRLVVDTGVLVSYTIGPTTRLTALIDEMIRRYVLLYSAQTMAELVDVLDRSKFDRYVSRNSRLQFIRRYMEIGNLVDVRVRIQASADPRDDKFLELAVDGMADAIVASDTDLTVLHPFRGIDILTPTEFATLHSVGR